MNILVTTYQGHVEGSTLSIAYLCQGLAQRGHNVYLGCRRESYLYKFISRKADNKVTLVPMHFKGKLDFQNIREIGNAVRKYKIELVNAQASLDRYSTILARWYYKDFPILIHTRRQRALQSGFWLKRLFYVKGTDRIVAISNHLKEYLMRKGYPASHIGVIHNGLPSEKFSINPDQVDLLRKEYKLTDNDVVIGCISRKKSQDQLIKALQYLPDHYKLLLVGVKQEQYQQLIDELELPHQIIFVGPVEPALAMHYYKLMTVNVLASTMDGFGLVLVEAMGLGIPVIATRSLGILDVVKDGDNGLLFDDKDIETLASLIKRVVSDDNLRNKLIKNGLDTAFEKFTIDKTIDQYESFFMQLIQQRKRKT